MMDFSPDHVEAAKIDELDVLENKFQDIALADSGKVMLKASLHMGMEDDVDNLLPETVEPAVESPSVQDDCYKSRRKLVSLGEEYVGTKDLLLRLLKSDYFDAWIGLNYLWQYSGKDSGMQYFLCERLKERPYGEIEFVLPQICHLVVFNSAESTPLESFLLDICHHSLHASIFTLWYLENYLGDIRESLHTREGAVRFDRCARILQEVQLAIWGDMIKPSPLRRLSREYGGADETDGDSSDNSGSASNVIDKGRRGLDTLPSVEATLVGFGCILSSFGSPSSAQAMKPLMLMESRRRDRFRTNSRYKTIRTIPSATPNIASDGVDYQRRPNTAVLLPMPASFPSIEDLSRGRAFSFKDALARTARQMKSPALNALLQAATKHQKGKSQQGPDWMPPLYYHPEMQFVLGLLDISRRLCLVEGKEGRQQSLQAELSLLNHNLPASLCVPLWCRGGHHSHHDHSGSTGGSHHQHHRLLRIPAGESVILNSAERVPFVMYIEVGTGIEDDEFHRLASLSRPDEDIMVSSPMTEVSAKIKTPPLRSERTMSASMETMPDMCQAHIVPPSPMDQPVDNDGFAERMRTAAIMLAQLTRQATQQGCPPSKLADIASIKAKLIAEMEGLEKSRLLDALQSKGTENDDGGLDPAPLYSLAADPKAAAVALKDDPSAAVFGESWEEKKARIRASSPYGHIPSWDLCSVIVKSGADMRQEQLACQLIEEMHDIWNMSGLPIWVYPFRILVAAPEGGLVETVRNALSIHSIKKKAYSARAILPDNIDVPSAANPNITEQPYSLRDHYIRTFGSPDSDAFINARDAFVKSFAGYSLVMYILQLKDRHNGNILIDSQGHMIHIDFGFMLANVPGGYYGFESAAFKLSAEYIDLMGGLHSESFAVYKDLMFHGFMALRKHADRLLLLLEISQKDSKLPCFGSSGPNTIAQLRQRFQLGLTEAQVKPFIDRMITGSAYNVFTRLYDSFQYYSNGIL